MFWNMFTSAACINLNCLLPATRTQNEPAVLAMSSSIEKPRAVAAVTLGLLVQYSAYLKGVLLTQ